MGGGHLPAQPKTCKRIALASLCLIFIGIGLLEVVPRSWLPLAEAKVRVVERSLSAIKNTDALKVLKSITASPEVRSVNTTVAATQPPPPTPPAVNTTAEQTVDAATVRVADLPRSKFELVSSGLWRASFLCVEARTGILFLAGKGVAGSETFDLNFDVNAVVKYKLYYSTPPTDAVLRDTVFWHGQLGRVDNLSHWLLHTVVPFMAVLLEFIKDRPFVASGSGRGFLMGISHILTYNENLVRPFVPNVTTCFREAFLGFPVMNLGFPVGQVYQYYDEVRGARYFDQFRRRMWARYGLPPVRPYASLWQGAAQWEPVVTITTRDGFGRNVSNADELIAYAASSKALRKVTVRAVDWAKLPLLAQIKMATETDIMLGVHGSNLAWMTLMQAGSVLVEVGPIACEAVVPGINIAAGPNWNRPFEFMAKRLQITGISWASSNRTLSPLISKERQDGQPFRHRCKSKSKRNWMCRDLILAPKVFGALIDLAVSKLGRFDNVTVSGMSITDA